MQTAAPDPRSPAARRRRRSEALRMRVAVIAVAGFLAIWAGLFVQLASGHDPGLNDGAAAAVVQSADPVVTDATATADGSSAAAPANDGGAVVTRQS